MGDLPQWLRAVGKTVSSSRTLEVAVREVVRLIAMGDAVAVLSAIACAVVILDVLRDGGINARTNGDGDEVEALNALEDEEVLLMALELVGDADADSVVICGSMGPLLNLKIQDEVSLDARLLCVELSSGRIRRIDEVDDLTERVDERLGDELSGTFKVEDVASLSRTTSRETCLELSR